MASSFDRISTKFELGLRFLCAVIPIAAFFIIGAFLVVNFDRGFDLTDESFYLLNAIDPFSVTVRLIDFGYYLKPILNWVSYDIYKFRLVGLLILSASTAVMALYLIRLLRVLGFKLDRLTQIAAMVSLIVASWMYYSPWLLSPGYNWLALIAVALSAASLAAYTCRVLSTPATIPLLALIGLGFSGVLTFVAKPPTAAFLGMITALWLVFLPSQLKLTQRLGHGLIALACAVMLLIFHFYFITEGISPSIEKYISGYTIFSDMKNYNSNTFLYMYWRFSLDTYKIIISNLFFIPIIAAFGILQFLRPSPAWIRVAILAFVINAVLMLILSGAPRVQRFGDFVLALTTIFLIFAVIAAQGKDRKTSIVLSLAYFAFAFAFHFGTGSLNAFHMAIGFLFFGASIIAASAMIHHPLGPDYTVRLAGVVLVAVTLTGLAGGIREPYRQRARVWDLTEPIEIVAGTTPLLVTAKRKIYMTEIRNAAIANGWKSGDPLLDLTGIRPGIALFLDAHPPALKWLPLEVKVPTQTLANILLKSERSELNRAWLLRAPKAKAKVSDDILPLIGLNFPDGYERIGIYSDHELWRPLRSGNSNLNRETRPSGESQ